MNKKMQELSKKCVEFYSADDIIEHLEEELAELLLAIKRVRRDREPIGSLVEELVDVKIEINTVFEMMVENSIINAGAEDAMMAHKLHKFETMLENAENQKSFFLLNRYKSIGKTHSTLFKKD